MARGTLYELEQDLELLGKADDNSFYEYAGNEFDYVVMASDPDREKQYLADMMAGYGMETGTVEYEGRTIPYVEITQKGKEAYFSEALHRLQKIVASITLQDFMSDQISWEIRSCVDDTYGDAVTCQDDEFQSLDRFMRTAEGRYYIGKILFMH